MKNKMNFKRVLSLLALAAIMVSMFAFTSCGKTANDAINSVVMIEDETLSGYGSGFAIGIPGKPVEFIVTNHHVVRKVDPAAKTAVVNFNKAMGNSVIAEIYYSDPTKDIAILKLPMPTEEREALVLCPTEYVVKGEPATALGYPAGQFAIDYKQYSTKDITVSPGNVSQIGASDGVSHIQHTCDTHGGNSGGPIVNEKGQVIAIHRMTTHSGDGTAVNTDSYFYGISIDELIRLVKAEAIPVDLSIAGDFPWLIVIIIGAVVLVAIIVLILILVLRKKPEQPVYSGPVTGPVVDNIPPAPAPMAGARLLVIGGILNGKKYNLSGTVRIGRDASVCAIAFPETKGVSRVHCEVTYDGSVCYLKDLGSSYGTFTSTGIKLTKDVPVMLRSGDKFYLASPENTFEIRF